MPKFFPRILKFSVHCSRAIPVIAFLGLSLRFSASNASRVNAWGGHISSYFSPSWRSSNNETATTTLTALAPFDGNELLIKTLFIVKVLFFLFSALACFCAGRLCAQCTLPSIRRFIVFHAKYICHCAIENGGPPCALQHIAKLQTFNLAECDVPMRAIIAFAAAASFILHLGKFNSLKTQ